MSYGIKISKPGENVFTAGTGDLFLDTSYPMLKIKQSGSGSLSVSDGLGADSDTITHNLGYIPEVLVYGQYYDVFSGNKNENYIRYPKEQVLSTFTSSVGYTVSSSNLVISGSFSDSSGDSYTLNYFYYIFYDEY